MLVSKYADHRPRYRQSQMVVRDGLQLERSTLADWVGGASALLKPLVEALGAWVMNPEKQHAGATPVPVLAEPRPDGGGLMCVATDWRAMMRRRRSGSVTRPTAKANIRPALYEIEQAVRSRSASRRQVARQAPAGPVLEALYGWLQQTVTTLAQRSRAACPYGNPKCNWWNSRRPILLAIILAMISRSSRVKGHPPCPSMAASQDRIVDGI